MSVSERVKEVVKWIIFQNYSKNETELAQKMGYNKNHFSQIVNGKVAITSKFINKLIMFDEKLNRDWILTGEGDMLNRNEVQEEKPKLVAEKELEYMKKINELHEQLVEVMKREKELLIKLYGDKYPKS